MKEAKESGYPRLLFRETFNSEQHTRRIGGVPTDVSYSDGKIAFEKNSSIIIYSDRDNFRFTKNQVIFRIRFNTCNDIITTQALIYKQIGGSSSSDNKIVLFIQAGNLIFGLKSVGQTTQELLTNIEINKKYECIVSIDNINGKLSLYVNSLLKYETSYTASNYTINNDHNINIGNLSGSTINNLCECELFEIYEGTATASEVENWYNNSWNTEQNFDGNVSSGSIITQPIDLTSGWSTTGATTITDSNNFDSNGGAGGVYKSILEGKKKYRYFYDIESTATTCALQVSTAGFAGRTIVNISGSGSGTIDFITNSDEVLVYIRNSNDGVTTVNSLDVKELEPEQFLDFDSTSGALENRTQRKELSQDLISNGNFSQGSTDWDVTDNITFDNISATFNTDGTAQVLEQDFGAEVGKTYKFTYEILTSSINDDFVLSSAGFGGVTLVIDKSVGTHTYIVPAQSTGKLRMIVGSANTSGVLSIDNIRLTEIIPELDVTDVEIKKSGSFWSSQFNGSTSKIDTSSDFIGTKAITIYGWIEPFSFGEGNLGRILDNGNFLFFISITTMALRLSSNGSTTVNSANDSIKLNKKQFVAVTRKEDGAANFYVGDLENAPALSGTANQSSGTPVAGTTNVIIGNNDAQNRTFDGNISKLGCVEGILDLQQIT